MKTGICAKAAATVMLLASAPAGAFETYELSCRSTAESVATNGDTGRQAATTEEMPQRYVVDTESRTVMAAYSKTARGQWEEHPQHIDDVRRLDDRMIVMCDNAITSCQPRFETSSDPRFAAPVTVTPVIIDLASGRLTQSAQGSRTHLATGRYIRFETVVEGRCERIP